MKMYSTILTTLLNYIFDNKFVIIGILSASAYWRYGWQFKRKLFSRLIKDYSKIIPRGTKLKILYGSNTGNTLRFSQRLYSMLNILNNKSGQSTFDSIERICTNEYDPGDELINDACSGTFIIIILPTYTNGNPPPTAEWFCKWIIDASNDFRLPRNSLRKLNYTILGIGDSVYGDNFCLCAFKLNSSLKKLQAQCFYPTSVVDNSALDSIDLQFSSWFNKICPYLFEHYDCSLVNFENEKHTEASDFDDKDTLGTLPKDNSFIDLEDIVEPEKKNRKSVSNNQQRDMITPDLRKELRKQGYRLIGTHSGVKLCRWTKSMLRGRGRFYKLFYFLMTFLYYF